MSLAFETGMKSLEAARALEQQVVVTAKKIKQAKLRTLRFKFPPVIYAVPFVRKIKSNVDV
ncbi:MAG TPA: hypothetical protein DCZ75_04115 [Geobacter sp.]|nr:hypothetical protein [Geobacter sp.]